MASTLELNFLQGRKRSENDDYKVQKGGYQQDTKKAQQAVGQIGEILADVIDAFAFFVDTFFQAGHQKDNASLFLAELDGQAKRNRWRPATH
jgi:hypothetical protein